MIFASSFLRPGTVVEVVDNYGTIKATSPGLFSVNDDPSLLPPIIPFNQGPANSFSSVLKDEVVWIFHDNANSQLFFYLRLNQLSQSVKDLLDSGDVNQEIIFSRDTDKGIYQMFFNDGTGIKFMKDGNYIQINPDGNIDIVTEKSNRSISISGDSICLGKKSDDASKVNTHAAYGERVEDCLTTINNILTQLQTLATPNPYTAALAPAFSSLPKLASQIEQITSNDVKII